MAPLYFIDIYDIAIAASLWEIGHWEVPYWTYFYRVSESGVAMIEICAGAKSVKEFLSEFEFDNSVVEILATQKSLSWIKPKFWEFLIGQKYGGKLWAKEDGTLLPNGEIYATMAGRAGEVFFFQYGVKSIFDFQISLAAEAHEWKSLAPTAKHFDAGSARSFGYGWSLWVTQAAIAAGFSAPALFKR